MTLLEQYLQDKRPLGQLLETALAEDSLDPDEFAQTSGAICVLHARGSRDVLDAARALAKSLDAKCRALAARILGELGCPHRSFPEECCDALLDLMKNDACSDVVIAAIYALGHLGNRRADLGLAALAAHPASAVRRGVAFALNGTISPDAVRALLQLMQDPNPETRDWAACAIAHKAEIDGADIREALLKGTQDRDAYVRGEALFGLALRRDRRTVPLLISELSRPRPSNGRAQQVYDAVCALFDVDEEERSDAEWLEALRRPPIH